MRKIEKTLFVDNLTEELKSSGSLVLVDFTGLSVKGQQELKKRLAKVNASMLVVKNTLLKRAGSEAKLPQATLSDTVLAGPTALILFKDDPIAPLQCIEKFAREFEIPQFKVGIIEGVYQDKDSLTRLAKLPSKQILFAQVIGAISAPLYGLTGTLQANTQKMLYLLKAKIEQ